MNQRKTLFWLQLCASLIFMGRAWQCLRWDAPLRALLWSQKTMEPLITGVFGIEWQHWVGNMAVDNGIQLTIRIMGGMLLTGAVAVWFVKADRRAARYLVGLAACVMAVLILLSYRRAYYQVGMLIEHGIQCGIPWLLLTFVRGNRDFKQILLPLKILIALTFIGHGLYAVGYYPTPGHFVTMLMKGFGMDENPARQILKLAGYADFVAALLIFIPKTARPALMYMALWGLATALARVLAYADLTFPVEWLSAWLHQTVYRLPHGLIPLMAWLGLQGSGATARLSQPQSAPTPTPATA